MTDVPNLSSAGIGSRFVSQDDIESARIRKEQAWKAAYDRIGIEPPPQQEPDSDGRSLAEARRKQDKEAGGVGGEIASSAPISCPRGGMHDEIAFLDQVREKREAEERIREKEDGEEVQNFKEAVAARTSALNNPPPPTGATTSKSTPSLSSKPAPAARKKGPLKGVVVKKKKPAAANAKESTPEAEQRDAKRRKIE
ncbi:Nefa-Nip30-N domain-containing protein [Mycena kentingensis (nom. inval.)]|nr:Nefa-Nip30-N domain-containing protein [Mycena kentingensis (nom. inval.)]